MNKELNDKTLENVNGGVIPIIFAGTTKVPTVDPIPFVPETKKVEMGNQKVEDK